MFFQSDIEPPGQTSSCHHKCCTYFFFFFIFRLYCPFSVQCLSTTANKLQVKQCLLEGYKKLCRKC